MIDYIYGISLVCFLSISEQSIKAAIEDSKRIKEKKKAEADEGRLKLFKQTKDEVELVISTENQELDASLVACQEDIEKTSTILSISVYSK